MTASSESLTSKGTVPHCRYCGEAIVSDTLLCRSCGKWRKIWLNDLSFWSGFTGVVTFILSGATFLYLQGTDIYSQFFGADLQFRNVSSLKNASISNNSNVSVILESLNFTFPGNRRSHIIVDRPIEPGGVLREDVGSLARNQTLSGHKYFFSPDYVGDAVDASGMSGAERTALIDDLNKGDWRSYTVEAINRDGMDYEVFEGGVGVLKVECRISASYQVVGGRRFVVDLPCSGILRHRSEPADLSSKPIPAWLATMIRSFDPSFVALP